MFNLLRRRNCYIAMSLSINVCFFICYIVFVQSDFLSEYSQSADFTSRLQRDLRDNNLPFRRIAQRGKYWVIHNFFPGSRVFQGNESITYTTHSDFRFLDNIPPLLKRWQGPVSIALHAPGTDFENTVASILYLKRCSSPEINSFVSFHIYFEANHTPNNILDNYEIDCSASPPWINFNSSTTYKAKQQLLYPVNVGRNIARDSATTYFVLPSDIELYPSPGIIPNFLEMMRRGGATLSSPNPKVFPLPIFEVKKNATIPDNKAQLVKMLKTGDAIPFHKFVCPYCHKIPQADKWILNTSESKLDIFHVAHRTGAFSNWEPIFIGTHQDPYYDERLSWEGLRDKMTQGYVFCVKDYEFQILNNAFLVHRPGIKKSNKYKNGESSKTNHLISSTILPQLKRIYGEKKGCVV